VLLYFFVIVPLIYHFFGDKHSETTTPEDPTKVSPGNSSDAVKLIAGLSGLLMAKIVFTKKTEDAKIAEEAQLPGKFMNVMH
jgi:hypothetical protein